MPSFSEAEIPNPASAASFGLADQSDSSQAWSPLSLTDIWLWYDISDLTTLFTDSAGTIPVTADGDMVGKILDKSGNGLHATEATDANKPIYKTSGGLHYLLFNGTTHRMSIPTNYDGDVGSSNTGCVGFKVTSASGGGRGIFAAQSDDGFEMKLSNGLLITTVETTVEQGSAVGSGSVANLDTVHTATWNRATGGIEQWKNQVSNGTASLAANDKKSGASAWLGALNLGATGFFVGNFYQGVICDALLSAGDTNNLEQYIALKSGVTL